MLEGSDILVGQQRGQLIAAGKRQDGVERIELFGARQQRVGGGGADDRFPCHWVADAR